jgi:hypothetical protein
LPLLPSDSGDDSDGSRGGVYGSGVFPLGDKDSGFKRLSEKATS